MNGALIHLPRSPNTNGSEKSLPSESHRGKCTEPSLAAASETPSVRIGASPKGSAGFSKFYPEKPECPKNFPPLTFPPSPHQSPPSLPCSLSSVISPSCTCMECNLPALCKFVGGRWASLKGNPDVKMPVEPPNCEEPAEQPFSFILGTRGLSRNFCQ